MKTKLIIIFCLLCGSAFAQLGNSTQGPTMGGNVNMSGYAVTNQVFDSAWTTGVKAAQAYTSTFANVSGTASNGASGFTFSGSANMTGTLRFADTVVTNTVQSGFSTIFSTNGNLCEMDSTGAITLLSKGLTGDTTVVIPPGSTYAQAQALVNATPKTCNGYNLTFTMENQTNVWTNSLVFDSFLGFRTLNVKGTTGYLTSTNIAQVTFLDGNSVPANGVLQFQYCVGGQIFVEGFKIRVHDLGGVFGIYYLACPNFATTRYCFFTADSKVNSGVSAIFHNGGVGIASYCMYQNLYECARVSYCLTMLNYCATTNTIPNYGLNVFSGGTASTNNCLMTGSTALYTTSTGGQVR